MALRTSITQSPEYKVFQSNFSQITAAIGPVLHEFACKAFEKDLISIDSFSDVVEGRKTVMQLVLNLTQKIGKERNSFYLIMEVLAEIPLLGEIRRKLEEACVSSILMQLGAL